MGGDATHENGAAQRGARPSRVTAPTLPCAVLWYHVQGHGQRIFNMSMCRSRALSFSGMPQMCPFPRKASAALTSVTGGGMSSYTTKWLRTTLEIISPAYDDMTRQRGMVRGQTGPVDFATAWPPLTRRLCCSVSVDAGQGQPSKAGCDFLAAGFAFDRETNATSAAP